MTDTATTDTATTDTAAAVESVPLPAINDETREVAERVAREAGRHNEQDAGKPLNEGQLRCLQTLLAIAPWHRLFIHEPHSASIELFGDGMSVLFNSTLSTYDDAGLTRLIVAAHDHAVRVEIGAWHTTYLDESDRGAVLRDACTAVSDYGVDADDITLDGLKITLCARNRSNDWIRGHPTLEVATANYREHPQMRRR